MVRVSEDEYVEYQGRVTKGRKDKVKDALKTSVRLGQQKQTVCVICGKALPKGREKYCSEKCSKKGAKQKAAKGKVGSVTGHKVNKCRYCGLRGDSKDGQRVFTDSSEVQWFRCPCSPQERQLLHVAKVEGGKEQGDD